MVLCFTATRHSTGRSMNLDGVHYDRLVNSGLYDELANSHLLVSHQEVNVEAWDSESAYKVLAPETIPFVSYPYEWCFGQLKCSCSGNSGDSEASTAL